MTVRVRDAIPADAQTLTRFNLAMAAESEDKTLRPERLARGIEAALEDPTLGRYWVAERDGTPVGALLVTFEWSDWRNGRFWWIQSVFVEPSARRQ